MPLSEDEQRILAEIEQQFYKDDPDLAERVREKTPYRHASRNVKWAAIGLLASLVFTFFAFRVLLLGALGFLLMLGCAVLLYHNLRKMGKAGYEEISSRYQARHLTLRDIFGRAGRRMRGRFGERPDDN